MPKFEDLYIGQPIPGRQHKPDNAYLFLYNAAIWNGHRIHYDHEYATVAEGYPGIVIDGPLQVEWIVRVATEWMGDLGELVALRSSHRRAAYLGETLTAGGKVAGIDTSARRVTVELECRNEKGEVTTPGEAVLQFFPEKAGPDAPSQGGTTGPEDTGGQDENGGQPEA